MAFFPAQMSTGSLPKHRSKVGPPVWITIFLTGMKNTWASPLAMADALNSNMDRMVHVRGTPVWVVLIKTATYRGMGNVSNCYQLLCFRMLRVQCVLGLWWRRSWDNHGTVSFSYGSVKSKYTDIYKGASNTVCQTVIRCKFGAFLVTISKVATPSHPVPYFLYIMMEYTIYFACRFGKSVFFLLFIYLCILSSL